MERHFPKIDLHLHLDGSFRPETVFQLSEAQGISLPFASPNDYRAYIHTAANCGDLDTYLKLFDLPLSVMQDGESLQRFTRELIEDLAAQGLCYAEIRFAPQLHCRRGLTQRQAVEAVLAGRKAGLAACPGIGIGVILCMMCIGTEQVNWAENAETAALAVEFHGRGVVAGDLAGAEGIVPIRNFAPLFDTIRNGGVPITCHAGDTQDPQTIADALSFGAVRIGHGHRLLEDAALTARCAREGVALEICPTSNIQCLSQPSYGAHTAKRLLDAGVPVTINTDNMTFAEVTLDDEYDHCVRDMGLTEADLVTMSRNAVQAAFLSDTEKTALLRRYFA